MASDLAFEAWRRDCHERIASSSSYSTLKYASHLRGEPEQQVLNLELHGQVDGVRLQLRRRHDGLGRGGDVVLLHGGEDGEGVRVGGDRDGRGGEADAHARLGDPQRDAAPLLEREVHLQLDPRELEHLGRRHGRVRRECGLRGRAPRVDGGGGDAHRGAVVGVDAGVVVSAAVDHGGLVASVEDCVGGGGRRKRSDETNRVARPLALGARHRRAAKGAQARRRPSPTLSVPLNSPPPALLCFLTPCAKPFS
eukprot:604722-Pleurochrysis_carterae.AAC.1